MAQSIHETLKGVRQNMRDEIKALSLEGWVPSRTNGGHIKLQHPDTETPVFCSSTPGDKKTHLYLRKDCRNALMGTTRFTPQSAPVSEETLRSIMRSRKAADRPAPRRGSRPPPPVELVQDDTPVSEPVPAPLEAPVEAPLEATEPPETPPEPTPKPKPQKEKRKMNMMTPPEARQADPVSEPPVRKPRATTLPDAEPKAPQAQGTGPVEYGIQLGLRIASGELKLLKITPDMVGQSLLFAQDPIVVGDLGAPAAPVAKSGVIRRNVKFDEMILAFIKEMGGRDVPLSLIGEHMVGEGVYKPRSAQSGVRQRIERLATEGRVGYRAAPGEPCASLIV